MATFPEADLTAFLDTAEAPAPEPAAPAEPTTEVPAEVTPVTDVPAAEPDVFQRDYVEQLRRESAGYRERAKKFEPTFEGMDESDRDTFLYLAETYKSDPAKAKAEALRIFGDLAVDDAPAPDAVDTSGFMTEARYNEVRQQERVDAEVRHIQAQAVELGYDTKAPEYQYLLAVAKSLPDGDLAKAHAHIESRIKSREQAAVDSLVAGKQAAAAGPVSPADSSGVPADQAKPITSIKDASAAANAWLDSQG